MARRRTKSMRQINQQTLGLEATLARVRYNTNDDRYSERMRRVQNINQRYRRNVANYFGESDGYVRNEDYDTQVPRSVYMGLNAG